MSAYARWLLLLVLVRASTGGASVGPKPGAAFEPYEIILQRKPFGEMPVLPLAVGPQLPAPPAFLSAVRLTAVVREDDGRMRVGFVHGPTQRAYWVELGQAEEGIEVVEADFRQGRARLRRGEEDFWLSLDGESVPAAKGPPSTLHEVIRGGHTNAESSPGAPPVEQPVTLHAMMSGGTSPSRAAMLSYAQRRRLREEARRQKRAAALRGAGSTSTVAVAAAVATEPEEPEGAGAAEPEEVAEPTREQMEEALMEYQMNRIRQGLPPLPVPLTPEMDEQLVREGVLPPVE